MKMEITWDEMIKHMNRFLNKTDEDDKPDEYEKSLIRQIFGMNKIGYCISRYDKLQLIEKTDFRNSVISKFTHKMEDSISRCELKDSAEGNTGGTESEALQKRMFFIEKLLEHRKKWLEYLIGISDEKPGEPYLV